MASCDINSEDEKGGKKHRSKSKSLMGRLKRPLSATQKPKGKVGTPSGSSAGEDTFSSSALIIFKDVRAERPPSLQSRPVASSAHKLRGDVHQDGLEERTKALTLTSESSPEWHPEGFPRPRSETASHEQANSLKSSASQNGDLHLRLEEHEPVVTGLIHASGLHSVYRAIR
ncbi:Suppressor of cytokine signaling 6 [Saguinus oedipus]|uniref:Suppressor of cytokine signaling 6 n=1 Tax=Saguinus oedipus TaxID=9490 RepID=A0ABQ9UW93_SAGOE|nr:Suppressor of cytokine signaling 6 [Saguinus oedipus]